MNLSTERLTLRRWRPEDRDLFAVINADARVHEHLPGPMTREDSDAMADRIEAHFEKHNFGLWAVELHDGPSFAGFVGLSIPRFEASFTPCVEIGWRLSTDVWGQGIATEAARLALRYGFDVLQLKEILSFTVPDNHASRRVMEKIGMSHDPADDFDHPLFPVEHRLSRHVLYRIQRKDS